MTSPRKQFLADCLFIGVCLFLIWLLNGCTTPAVYPRHSLAQQILIPRKGYTGLTNMACLTPSEDGEPCSRPEILEYKFEDAMFRDHANRLNFICRVGAKRYKICIDKPGLCRRTYKKKFFGGDEPIEEYLSMPEQYGFLIAGNAVCGSENEYDLQGW